MEGTRECIEMIKNINNYNIKNNNQLEIIHYYNESETMDNLTKTIIKIIEKNGIKAIGTMNYKTYQSQIIHFSTPITEQDIEELKTNLNKDIDLIISTEYSDKPPFRQYIHKLPNTYENDKEYEFMVFDVIKIKGNKINNTFNIKKI